MGLVINRLRLFKMLAQDGWMYFHFDGDENYRNYQLSNAIPFLQMFLSTKEIGNQLPEFPLVSFLETQCPMNKWIHSSRFQMGGEKFFSLKRYGYSMARLNLSHTLREVFFRGKWINVFFRIDVTIVFPLSFFFSYDKRKLKILEILRRGGRVLEKIDIS